MSVRDEVAALPHGGGLAELIDQVTSSAPGYGEQVAQRWRTASGTLQGSGQALHDTAAGVDGAWQGSASDGFVGYMNGVVSACDTTRSALDDAAGTIAQADQVLQGARREVESRCESLLGEVARLRASATPQTSPEQVESAVAGLVDQVHGEVTPIVSQADQQLSALAGKLAPGPTPFASLPDPNTAPFVPQPGRPGDWTPQAGAGTAPAGRSGVPAQAGGPPPPAADPPAGSPPAAMQGAVGANSSFAAAGHLSGGGGGGGGHHGGGGSGGGSGGGGGGGGGVGSSGGPPSAGSPAPQGQVADWIQQAIDILRQEGYPVDKMNPHDIWTIIQHESGGNPNAINNWDSNAAAGHPSKGLMQTIDSTFNSYKAPGHDNIYNPVDNILAGIRYSISRYGSVSNVPGVVGLHNGGGYRGY